MGLGRLSLVAVLSVACGRSVAHGTDERRAGRTGGTGGAPLGAGSGGAAGSSAGTVPAGNGGMAGAPEPRTNCAFPVEGARASGVERIDTLSRPDCRYALGGARTLPFTNTNGTFFDYAFSFDVNGDGVGDLFFWKIPPNASRSRYELALAVSHVDAGRLSYERVDCDALREVPWGRTVVRDVDADGVFDIVVNQNEAHGFASGEVDRFVVLLNRPSGFVLALDHAWPEDTSISQTALLDVATGDFDDDGSRDVAFGYDRGFQRVGSTEFELAMGATLFLGTPREPELHVAATLTEPYGSGAPFTTGKLTVLPSPDGPLALVLVQTRPRSDDAQAASVKLVRYDGSTFVEETTSVEASLARLGPFEGPFEAWTLPIDEGKFAVGLLYESEIRFHALGTPGNPTLHVQPTVRMHERNNAVGGGPETRDRFMVDVEGDGDLDFVEFAPWDASMVTTPLAIHPNSGGVAFGDARLVDADINLSRGYAETPFASVGDAGAAIFVNDEAVDGTSPTVQALECAEP